MTGVVRSNTPMQWVPWSLEVITPMFLGAADPSMSDVDTTRATRHRHPTVHVPVASLRGALRYWLRALIGAHVGNHLDALRAAERLVFGSAAVSGDVTRGRSPVALRATSQMDIVPAAFPAGSDWLESSQDFNGVAYLLGQGLYKPGAKGHLRRYVPVGAKIDLYARIAKSGAVANSIGDLFLAALWALQAFGGSGARVRRGFGTLLVVMPSELPHAEFQPDLLARDTLEDMEEVLDVVKSALQALGVETPNSVDGLPTYPCFAPERYLHSEWNLTSAVRSEIPGIEPMVRALAETGERLRSFRICHDPSNSDRLRRHTPEYDQIIEPFLTSAFGIGGADTGWAKPFEPFLAGALGLPTGYSDTHGPKGNGPSRRSAVVAPFLDGREVRRASPLWLRPKPPANSSGPWRLRSLAFLGQWMPGDTKLRVSAVKKPPRSITAPSQDDVERVLRLWFERGNQAWAH